MASKDPTDTVAGYLAEAKRAVQECIDTIYSSGDRWTFLLDEISWITVPGSDVYFPDDIVGTTRVLYQVLEVVCDQQGVGPMRRMGWEALERFAPDTQHQPH